jgi:hypothetical protein
VIPVTGQLQCQPAHHGRWEAFNTCSYKDSEKKSFNSASQPGWHFLAQRIEQCALVGRQRSAKMIKEKAVTK